jgi:transposase-like protein
MQWRLDDLAREGARRMIATALAVEVEDYVGRYAGGRDERGRALVVRNGTARSRGVTLGAGTIEVQAPRVNDRRVADGERQKFTSRILPPYMRRSPKVDAVLPLLYLHGLSTGDFQEALPALLGDDAAGLSPSAITRLTHVWRDEYVAWTKRSLVDRDYVYVWVRRVWPETREQRCWFHKLGNVLDKLPRRLQPQAKGVLHEALYAAKKSDAVTAIAHFADEFGAKYSKAVECLKQDQDALLAFFDFPAEHWKHLRTTNPIESAFSTVKLRSRVTRGAGSRAAGLTMTYKLLRAAEATWRRLDGQELIPLVRAGIRFVDGKRQERDSNDTSNEGTKKVRKAAA